MILARFEVALNAFLHIVIGVHITDCRKMCHLILGMHWLLEVEAILDYVLLICSKNSACLLIFLL